MIYLCYPTVIDFPAGLRTGKLDGEEAWSNGHVMYIGLAPANAPEEDSKEIDFSNAVQSADPGGMPEIFPAVVADAETSLFGELKPILCFSDGKTVISYDYYQSALERWPDARFFSDGTDPHHVRVESKGARVGLIARRRTVPQLALQVLQSANAGRRKPRTNPEKSAKPRTNPGPGDGVVHDLGKDRDV